MATAQEYAAWIVQNSAKRGSPEFDTVAQAYQLAKERENTAAFQQQNAPLPQEPGVMDQIANAGKAAVGGLEAAVALIPGGIAGALGLAEGAATGLAKQILSGQFGTPDAMRAVEQSATNRSEVWSRPFQPRTQAGQETTQEVGQFLSQAIPPVLPVIAAPNALTQAARAIAPTAGAVTEIAVPAAQRGLTALQQTATTTGQAIARPVQAATTAVRDMVMPTEATPLQTAMPPMAMKAAPIEVLADAGVRARPSASPLDVATTGKRDLVLDAIGIPADSRRLGARTGDKNQIQTEIMLSKLEGAETMRQQLDLESQRLAEYASSIQRDTGGTVGATPLMRGEAISAPLEGYQNWYNGQINSLYKQANEAAAGQGGIRLERLKSYLNEPANFKGDGRTVSRDMRNELVRLGVMDKDGKLAEIDAPKAERIRQEANRLFDPTKPQTKNAVGGVKDAIDEDVLSVLPSDVYKDARAKRTQYREIFEDPKGLAQILDISGPEGVNRAVALDVLPDKLVNYAAKNTAQFNNIIRTLEALPTPELQELGKKALAEVRAHLVEKMISKNIDPTEAALGGAVVWKGTDDTLSRQMAPYRGKTKQLLGDELADRLETLRVGSRILRPFDPNPSGTATTALNLQTELSKKAISAAGGLAGAGIGAVTGGPAGAAGGAIAGASAAKKIIDVRQQKAIDRAIEKSLRSQPKPMPKTPGQF
jgi:hypothetical protein